MAKGKMIFKNWRFVCPNKHKFHNMQWDYEPLPKCPECGEEAHSDFAPVNQAPGVISDEIDIHVRHGLINPDGSPRHFTSMTELRKAAAEKGLVISGETPNLTAQQREEVAREKEERARRWA